MTPKTRKRLVLVVSVTALFGAIGAHTDNVSGVVSCDVCRSTRRFVEWGFGSDRHWIHLFTAEERIWESQAYLNLCDPTHRHEWGAGNFRVASWFGLVPSTIGDSWNFDSEIARAYEENQGFRAYTSERIQLGTLTKGRLLQLLSLPTHLVPLANLGERGKQLDHERTQLLEDYARSRRQPNSRIELSVRPVTAVAWATAAPVRPAAHADRSTDRNHEAP